MWRRYGRDVTRRRRVLSGRPHVGDLTRRRVVNTAVSTRLPARPAPSDINYFLYTLGRRHVDVRDCRLGFVSNRAGRGPRRRRLQARRPAGDGYTTTHDLSTPDICPPLVGVGFMNTFIRQNTGSKDTQRERYTTCITRQHNLLRLG